MNPVTALSSILGAMPSASAIAAQVATGVAGTVILSGLQSASGQNALDPLHLIFKPNTTTATADAQATSASRKKKQVCQLTAIIVRLRRRTGMSKALRRPT